MKKTITEEASRPVSIVKFSFPKGLVGVSDIHSQGQLAGSPLSSFGRGVSDSQGNIKIGPIGASHAGLGSGMQDAKRFYFGYSKQLQTVYVVAKNGMDVDFFKNTKILQTILSNIFDMYKLSVAQGKRLTLSEGIQNLSEKFSIVDLDNNAVSDLTSSFLFDREHGSGSNQIKLFDCQLRGDKLYLHYRSFPTYTVDATRISTNGSEIATKYYDTLFEFSDAEENLGDANTFNSFSTPEKASVLRDFLENGMARTWCNCPAYFFQGMWQDMNKLDSTIFPFPGPKGNGVWRSRHAAGLKVPEIRICKHIAASIHHLLKRDINAVLEYVVASDQMKVPASSASVKGAVPISLPLAASYTVPENTSEDEANQFV